MKQAKHGGWLVFGALLLVACVRSYAPPEPTQQSAELILARGDGSESNTFLAYRDDACTSDGSDTGLLGVVDVFSAGPKAVRVRTGTRLFVKAVAYASKFTVQGLAGLEQRYCVNVVSFVPQPRKRYQVRQQQSATECSTLVIDNGTGQPVGDLVQYAI